MTCDKCAAVAAWFVGIGSTGQRLCDEHYAELKHD